MTIETSSGKMFEAEWALDVTTRHGEKQLIIQLPGTADVKEIVSELAGAAKIRSTKESGVSTMYEGYTLLQSVSCARNRGSIRVTLTREE